MYSVVNLETSYKFTNYKSYAQLTRQRIHSILKSKQTNLDKLIKFSHSRKQSNSHAELRGLKPELPKQSPELKPFLRRAKKPTKLPTEITPKSQKKFNFFPERSIRNSKQISIKNKRYSKSTKKPTIQEVEKSHKRSSSGSLLQGNLSPWNTEIISPLLPKYV